jgi:putative transposase
MSLNPAAGPGGKPSPGQSCACGCRTRVRRYPTDTTDAQWAVLEPLLPTPASHSRTGGRPERHHRRAVIDAIFYLVDNGVKWRALPADFPPWRTIYGLLTRWSDNLSTIAVTDRLRADLRTALGRNPQPTAGCIDSQSVHETAEATVENRTSGFDPHKRVNGRKRHISVDTLGLLLCVVATPANCQDQHAGRALIYDATRHGITHIWADKGYHVQAFTEGAQHVLGITIDIVHRNPTIPGLQILPRRWVVERTFAWISRRRRCARDHERRTDHHETMVHWAAILTMTRRRARIPPPHPRV